MSSPFIGKSFEFTQPDGTKFQVKGWGDQHHAVFETTDGYTLTKNPATGFFEIAQVSDDGSMLESAPGPQGNMSGLAAAEQPGLRIDRDAARARGVEGAQRLGGRRCDQRRAERRNLERAVRTLGGPVMAPPQRGTVGDFVGLCLLIDFPDEHGTIARAEVQSFCNQQGYSGFGNNGSVRDYFFDNSIGRCRYTNVVAEYYRALHPKSHYTNPAIPQGVRARQLIVEALTHLQNNNFDFSQLIADSGGFVYALNVYYAGEVVNNWAEGLWPHAWHLANPVQLMPGKAAFDYQFTDMSHQLTLGTFCHENGHMLCDYPDLYDYGGESSGTGAFCLMCAGGNIDEKNPTHISAYLKRLSGWASAVTQLEHGQEVVLAADENQFALFAKNSGEYFVVENRHKSGRDQALPDQGLAIWHVDENGNNSNEQMSPSQHYELSLEQADGQFRLENHNNQLGDNTDLFGQGNQRFADATTPNSRWWDGTASNLELFEIDAPAPSVSFKVKLIADGDQARTVVGTSSPALAIPDMHPGGVTDTITMDQDVVIANTRVGIDIDHSYRGDLEVTLLTPWGDAIILHPRQQGGDADNLVVTLDASDLPALANLHGRSSLGDWQLRVQDLAPADEGTLNRWSLEFSGAAQPVGPVVLEEAPGILIPDDDPSGVERTLSTSVAGAVDRVEVSVDISHTWKSDLSVILRSPSGTEVILHQGTGADGDNIVETYSVATTPALAAFSRESVAGDWKLIVSDRAEMDIGKLNTWRLVVHVAP